MLAPKVQAMAKRWGKPSKWFTKARARRQPGHVPRSPKWVPPFLKKKRGGCELITNQVSKKKCLVVTQIDGKNPETPAFSMTI